METLKTNEEIKKEISETMEELSWVVEGGDAHDLQDACDKAHACLADTLALIERLESDVSFYKGISKSVSQTNDKAVSLINRLITLGCEKSEKIGKLTTERDTAVKALMLVSDKVEQAQDILDNDVFHRVGYNTYLALRNMVDDILSWQVEAEEHSEQKEQSHET